MIYRNYFPRLLLLAAVVMLSTFHVAAQQARLKPTVAPTPRPPELEKIVINTLLVSLMVSVTDEKGRFVGGLGQSAFTVYEDGIAQQVSLFSTADGPASIGVVFDRSNSMSGRGIERARLALARFVQTGHPEDEYWLTTFNHDVQTRLERVYDAEALLRQTSRIEPNGATALYDAVAQSLRQLQSGRYAKRALIVISDGGDNRSRATLRDLRRMAQESGVMIYSIAVDDYFSRRASVWVMDELASCSGGRSFSPEGAEQMSEAFDQIALDLRQQYSLGYEPTASAADGKLRRLKVKVTPPPNAPRLKVRSRTGYYATADHVAQN